MTYNDFVEIIKEGVEQCPKNWREGQKVFNVIEDLFGGIARDVQFIDGVDCFYDDTKIDLFMDHAWVRVFSAEHPIIPREEN